MVENTNSNRTFSNFWVLKFYSTKEISIDTIMADVFEIFHQKPDKAYNREVSGDSDNL